MDLADVQARDLGFLLGGFVDFEELPLHAGGDEQSAADDSFSGGLLEAPQYTRPADFRGWKIPDVLLSGNHAEIAEWRKKEALRRTKENRPDLLDK